ncbi:MAG: hypothetical protein U9R69_07540, partial [Thermodesulfobacteriota bacterium]|nr:hypothetical protein [Thermodesulfobacteriota bacterium]
MDLTSLHLHWRASKYKGKSYRSYSLARAYREDGKNRKEIFVKLGKLSDEAANQWRTLLKALKKPGSFITTGDDIAVVNHYAYLDVATVGEIWDYWKLDDIFPSNGRRGVDISSIAKILTINRCVDPASKWQIPLWFKNTALPWLLNVKTTQINSSRIFRELGAIEQNKEAVCAHLFELMSKRNPESMKSVFYDLSSTTFSGSRCLLMKWGHCKEGYQNHVVLAIIVNNDGLPFY